MNHEFLEISLFKLKKAQPCHSVGVQFEKITNFHKFVLFVQKESVIIIIIIINIITLYYNFVFTMCLKSFNKQCLKI